MAAVFPIDTSQPWVNNGVTYVYNADTDSWQAVGSTATENLQDLEDRVDAIEAGGIGGLAYMLQTNLITGGDAPAIDLVDSDDGFSNVKIEGVNGINVTSTGSSIVIDGSDVQAIADLDDYYTKTEVDAADEYLQDQIDNLTITKGEASTYTLNEIGIAVGVRPGDFFIDNPVVSSLKFISLSPLDDNNNNRPVGEEGDVLEINGPNNVSYRYSIEQISEGIAAVDYTIGTADDDVLVPGTAYSIYIYPKNGSSASVDYVNSQLDTKLSLTGGELSGNLTMNGGTLNTDALVKSTRTSGYAFQVYNESSDSNPAFIHSNGNIRGAGGTFTDSVEIRNTLTLKEGAWIAGNLGFHQPTKGIRFYNDDQSTHFVDITRQGVNLQTLVYGDNLWTLKVQDSSNVNSNTLIYADYSSGLILNEVGELNTNGNVSIGGNLSFPNGGQINVSTGGTVLSGRASLDIKTAADYPVVISSGSSYKKILAFYGYDGSQDDNRGEVASIYANGNAHFTSVYSNGKELSTRTYVDSKVADLFSIVEAEDAEPDIHYGTTTPAESGDGDLWVDTTNMRLLMRVNGAWVNPDRQDSVVDLSPYQKIVSPPGRKFRKLDATNPNTDGTFTYYETNGQVKLGINRRDAEGTKWLDISFNDSLSAPVLFRIIQWQNNSSHKTVRYGAIDKIVATDGGHVVCDVKYHQTNGSLANGSNYFIIIGGLL